MCRSLFPVEYLTETLDIFSDYWPNEPLRNNTWHWLAENKWVQQIEVGDPNIDSVDTNPGIGTGSILAQKDWYFLSFKFSM